MAYRTFLTRQGHWVQLSAHGGGGAGAALAATTTSARLAIALAVRQQPFARQVKDGIATAILRGYQVTAASEVSRRFFHATSQNETTILCVRKDGKVCMIGDGMVSQGNTIVKPNAVKIRRILPKGSVTATSPTLTSTSSQQQQQQHQQQPHPIVGTIVGFAGSTADAFTLLERLEGKLDEYPGQLARSCVELAKGWRTDKYLRRLEASIIVADASVSLELTGNGDVLESHDGILGVGSGSGYAIAAARALMDVEGMTAEDIARKAIRIAADMDIYSNHTLIVETIETVATETASESASSKITT